MKTTILSIIIILLISCGLESEFPRYAGNIGWAFGMIAGYLVSAINDSQS